MAKELLQLYSLFLEIDLLRTLYIDGVIENINMMIIWFFYQYIFINFCSIGWSSKSCSFIQNRVDHD